jgi:hypothetical protein
LRRTLRSYQQLFVCSKVGQNAGQVGQTPIPPWEDLPIPILPLEG